MKASSDALENNCRNEQMMKGIFPMVDGEHVACADHNDDNFKNS